MPSMFAIDLLEPNLVLLPPANTKQLSDEDTDLY